MLSLSKTYHFQQIRIKALSLIQFFKRVSFLSSLSLNGGMTLEGCLVLPLFLFFIVTLLFSLEIIRFQSDCLDALYLAGNKSCMLAYKEDFEEETYIRRYLDEQVMPYLCVQGEREGFIITRQEDSVGNVELQASYTIKSFVPWLPIGTIQVKQRFFGHEWVGYRGERAGEWKEEKELYVYVTETGERYHYSPNCTYLKVILQAVSGESVGALRNSSGEKYYACEVCRPKGKGMVYLTQWGNRYHGETDCTALKRTVYMIPISQVGMRLPCSKCGKEYNDV